VGPRRNASRRIAYAAILLVTATGFATTRSLAGASAQPRRSGAHPTSTRSNVAHRTFAHPGSVLVDETSIPSASMAALSLNAPVVGMAATPNGKGSWRVAADGGVFTAGNAPYFGSAGALRLHQPIVGMAATPTGRGYWFVARDGGLFTYGDAHFYGSTGGFHLNQPIVGMAATPTGRGYWLVASDGGVFSFGDAHFYGSTGAIRLNQPIVGAASTPTGHGYWFVARDGGVFSFGDAHFHGSVANTPVDQPIVGMAAAPHGNGYLLLSTSGRVFNFGSASNYGSAANACTGAPAVAIATASKARGYWIAFANAQAYALSPASSGPKCQPSTTTRIGAAAADLFGRMNDERGARGLAPLNWNPTLANYAAAWSKTMGSSTLHHSNIGQLLGPFDYVGENIAMGSAGVSAGALHGAWMHSQEHRDNILSPGYQQAGIGVYCGSDGSIWATAEFARPTTAGPPAPYNGGTSPTPVARPGGDSLTCGS
jgi:uncharacterized protein YkwD